MSSLAIEISPALRRLRRIAIIAFAVQLTFMAVGSFLLWSHYSVTTDFAVYWQAWSKISQGHLNPYDSIGHYPFWKDHGVFLIWPIAMITHFGFDGLTPMIVQDLAVFAAEIIAFAWVLRLLRENEDRLPVRAWMLGGAALTFLIANQGTYWALAYDVHLDITLAAPFVVLILRALYYRDYRWLPVWVALCLLCGDVAAVFVAAIGLSGLIASGFRDRRRLLASGGLVVVGSAVFVLLTHLQGGPGAAGVVASGFGSSNESVASLSPAGQISSVLLHPNRVLSRVFAERTNLWAMISPAGPFGLLSIWGLPLAAVTAVANAAAGQAFTFSAFQYAALWSPLVVAGVLAAISLAKYRWARRVVGGVLALSVLNTALWVVVWLPRLPAQSLRVDASVSAALTRADHLIPREAEVIGSQGIVGRFGERDWVYAFPLYGDIKPVMTRDVYFVVVPFAGIELAQADESLRLLGALAGPMHATLVMHDSGVWVFRWRPPSSVKSINVAKLAYGTTSIPVWAAHSAVGKPVLIGPSRNWSLTTSSQSGGYVMDGAYFNRPVGQYVLRVRMATTGSVNVEAWNDTGDVLLGRRIVPETDKTVTVEVPVPNLTAYPKTLFTGTFGFQARPLAPPAGQVLEARVYVPAHTSATIYSVHLVKATQ